MNTLSKTECTILRGIAILGIFIHNFCHLLPGIVKENEFTFKFSNSETLINALQHPDINLPINLISFFGHYGVALFLFLSGYGLVIKYERDREQSNDKTWSFISSFLSYNWLKLTRLCLVGIALFILLITLAPNPHIFNWKTIVYSCTMTANLRGLLPVPGAFWFFGLMIQLYIIYCFLHQYRHWSICTIAILLSLALQYHFKESSYASTMIHINFIGHLLAFCAGIMVARSNKSIKYRKIYWIIIWLVATILFIVLSTSFIGWLFVPLFIIISAIAFIRILPQQAYMPFKWVGVVSASIFIAHPVLRDLFLQVYQGQHLYSSILVYFIAVIFLSLIVNNILKTIPSPRQRLTQARLNREFLKAKFKD